MTEQDNYSTMLIILVFLMGLCMVGLHGVPVDNEMPTNSDRTLYIRSLPGYPGVRSDLYEVYMEPYYFVSRFYHK